MSGQLNFLRRDRRSHTRTARLMESEANVNEMRRVTRRGYEGGGYLDPADLSYHSHIVPLGRMSYPSSKHLFHSVEHEKRLCIALGPKYEVGECSSAPTARPTRGFIEDYGFVGTLDAKIRHLCDLDKEIGYGFTDVREDPDEIAEEITVTDVAELGQRMTDFVTTVRQDTNCEFMGLDGCTGRLARLRAFSEAWVQSMDASDTARSETQMAALQSQQRPARDPAHPDVLEEAGTHDADRSQNGDDNHNSGTGVVGLTQWFERMETVFNISNCAVENQVKFATYTFHGVALTWWKSHVKTVGQDAAHSMPWNTLMKMMTAKYFPRNEIKN
ncbi:hypothetical protein Tco_0568523 [Tanacetum coccineum]